MRLLILAFFLFTSGFVFTQEKFLELTLISKEENKSLKNFDVLVSCEDGVDFILTAKKKKITFYLSAGLDYKIVVTKKGYYQTNYEIDLTTVPKAVHQDDFLTHTLTVHFIPTTKVQPTDVFKYGYESRYGKLKIE